jgi:hypothetical protein
MAGNNHNSYLVSVCVLLAMAMLSMNVFASPPLPQSGEDMHLGVATCAGSTCHGAIEPFTNSPVLQNEFISWQRKDSHSEAYNVLLNEQSRRIAQNLGLKSAQTAKICLDCHADNVPVDKRGKRFQISDGVGCETCHGGAQRYLGLHVSGQATHQQNIDAGLFPSENPFERAKLCLSCHLGNDNKFVTHRIMGAGHPRLSFELDTFTAIEPAHFQVDDDYRERKGSWSNVQTWAFGQIVATQQYLKQLSSGKRMDNSLFPEMAFFDCHSCHHSMKQQRWAPRESVNLDPGSIRLNDGNILMMRELAKVIDVGLANQISQQMLALHQASQQSKSIIQLQAKKLHTLNQQLLNKLGTFKFGKKTTLKVANNIINQGIAGQFRDYSGAEQSVMALDALFNSLKTQGAIDYAPGSPISLVMDKLYNALANEDGYIPERYISELETLRKAL